MDGPLLSLSQHRSKNGLFEVGTYDKFSIEKS